MHVGPSAQRRSSDRPPTESDTSEHSYTLRPDAATSGQLNARRSSSPFGMDAFQTSPFEAGPRAGPLVPIARAPSDRPPRAQARRPGSIRVSVDVPESTTRLESGMLPEMTGRIVRRRRRIPLWLTLAFGAVTCAGLILAVCIAPLTVYNYRRIKSQRAAKTVDQLQALIVPMLQAIYNATVNAPPAGR